MSGFWSYRTRQSEPLDEDAQRGVDAIRALQDVGTLGSTAASDGANTHHEPYNLVPTTTTAVVEQAPCDTEVDQFLSQYSSIGRQNAPALPAYAHCVDPPSSVQFATEPVHNSLPAEPHHQPISIIHDAANIADSFEEEDWVIGDDNGEGVGLTATELEALQPMLRAIREEYGVTEDEVAAMNSAMLPSSLDVGHVNMEVGAECLSATPTPAIDEMLQANTMVTAHHVPAPASTEVQEFMTLASERVASETALDSAMSSASTHINPPVRKGAAALSAGVGVTPRTKRSVSSNGRPPLPPPKSAFSKASSPVVTPVVPKESKKYAVLREKEDRAKALRAENAKRVAERRAVQEKAKQDALVLKQQVQAEREKLRQEMRKLSSTSQTKTPIATAARRAVVRHSNQVPLSAPPSEKIVHQISQSDSEVPSVTPRVGEMALTGPSRSSRTRTESASRTPRSSSRSTNRSTSKQRSTTANNSPPNGDASGLLVTPVVPLGKVATPQHSNHNQFRTPPRTIPLDGHSPAVSSTYTPSGGDPSPQPSMHDFSTQKTAIHSTTTETNETPSVSRQVRFADPATGSPVPPARAFEDDDTPEEIEGPVEVVNHLPRSTDDGRASSQQPATVAVATSLIERAEQRKAARAALQAEYAKRQQRKLEEEAARIAAEEERAFHEKRQHAAKIRELREKERVDRENKQQLQELQAKKLSFAAKCHEQLLMKIYVMQPLKQLVANRRQQMVNAAGNHALRVKQQVFQALKSNVQQQQRVEHAAHVARCFALFKVLQHAQKRHCWLKWRAMIRSNHNDIAIADRFNASLHLRRVANKCSRKRAFRDKILGMQFSQLEQLADFQFKRRQRLTPLRAWHRRSIAVVDERERQQYREHLMKTAMSILGN